MNTTSKTCEDRLRSLKHVLMTYPKGDVAVLNKIKDTLLTVLTKGKGIVVKAEQPIKWVIASYFAVVLILIVTYYCAWVYLFLAGKSTLAELLAILQETIGPAMIAFITFIAGCFVDLNDNGIPDKLEQERGKDRFAG